MIIVNNITEEIAKDILLKSNKLGKDFILYRSIGVLPEYMRKQLIRKYFMIEADDFYYNEEFCYIGIDHFRELNSNGKKELIANIRDCKVIIHNLDVHKSMSGFINAMSGKNIEDYNHFLDLLCEKEFRTLITSMKKEHVIKITSLKASYINTDDFKVENNDQTERL